MLPLSINPRGLIERLVHATYCVLLDRDNDPDSIRSARDRNRKMRTLVRRHGATASGVVSLRPGLNVSNHEFPNGSELATCCMNPQILTLFCWSWL